MKRHAERGGTRSERVGKNYPEIDGALRAFIERQKMFLVASAPSGSAGHVNVSPKGLDTFRVLGPRRVGYLDYNGSGVETIAHVRENGRLTIMFCAFEGKPNIVRLYGTGRVVEPGAAGYDDLLAAFGLGGSTAKVRSIIVLEVERISDSCGFGVPLYSYVGDREQLTAWSERKTAEEIRAYQRGKNGVSIDGLRGLESASS